MMTQSNHKSAIRDQLENRNGLFQSVAQTLQQIRPPSPEITETTLRQDCKQFALRQSINQEQSWFKEQVEHRYSIPEYIAQIGFTEADVSQSAMVRGQESVKAAISGTPEIEGRILCDTYDVKLHVIQIQTCGESDTWIHKVVDKHGCQIAHCSYEDERAIHILAQSEQQFQPILRLQSAPSIINFSHQDVQSAIQSDNVKKLQEVLSASPLWPFDELRLPFATGESIIPWLCEEFQVQEPLSMEMKNFLEIDFGFRQLFAAMKNLQQEYSTANEVIHAVCTALDTFQKYLKYYFIKKELSHHIINLTFLSLLVKQYNQLVDISEPIPRQALHDIELPMSLLLLPLMELERYLSLDSKIKEFKLALTKKSNGLLKDWNQIQQLVGKMADIKPRFAAYRFGPLQRNLVIALRSGFENLRMNAVNAQQDRGDLTSNLYEAMQDISALERILHYIDQTLLVNLQSEGHIAQLVFEKALQVTGEYLKNTDKTVHISKASQEKLKKKGVDIGKLMKLRNSLSHSSTISAFLTDDESRTDTTILEMVKHDFKKIQGVILKFLQKLKSKQIQIFLKNTFQRLHLQSDEKLKQAMLKIETCKTRILLAEAIQDASVAVDSYTGEGYKDIKAAFNEALIMIQLKDISEEIKLFKEAVEIHIPASFLEDRMNFKIVFTRKYELLEYAISDSISTISQAKGIDKMQAFNIKMNGPLNTSGTYGLDITDILAKEIIKSDYGTFEGPFKQFGYGFSTELNMSWFKKHSSNNSVHVDLLGALQSIIIDSSSEIVNNDLKRFIDGVIDFPSLYESLKIKEHFLDGHWKWNTACFKAKHEKDYNPSEILTANAFRFWLKKLKIKKVQGLFQDILQDVHWQVMETSKTIHVLDSILENMFDAAQDTIYADFLEELRSAFNKAKEVHSAKIKLVALCTGIKTLYKTEFVELLTLMQCINHKKKVDSYYISRLKCKTFLDRVQDPYGKLLLAIQNKCGFSETKTSFQKFLKALKFESNMQEILLNAFSREIEKQYEVHFHQNIQLLKGLIGTAESKIISQDDGHSRVIVALEMLIFKLMNTLKEISATTDVFGIVEKLIQISSTHRLGASVAFPIRNFLAHGDILKEIMNTDISNLVLSTAKTLATDDLAFLAIPVMKMLKTTTSRRLLMRVITDKSIKGALKYVSDGYAKYIETIQTAIHWIGPDWRANLLNLIKDRPTFNLEIKDPLSEACLFSKLATHELSSAVIFNDSTMTNAFLPYAGSNARHALHLAAESGSLTVMQLLLSQNFEVNGRGKNNYTPLHSAVLHGQYSAAKCLIEHEADVQAMDADGYSPLHIAAMTGSTDIIQLLTELTDKVPEVDGMSTTPLHLASLNGFFDAVKILIAKGATVDTPDKEFRTPLFSATAKEHIKIVELLLEKGANATGNAKFPISPLHIAIVNGNLNLVKLLHNHANVNTTSHDMHTPLHLACNGKLLDIAEVLLKAGSNINAVNSKLRSPVHLTAMSGDAEIMELLLRKGADVATADQVKCQPLHYSVVNGHMAITKMLIEKGANVNASAKFKVTPLALAINNGHIQVSKMLLQHGVKVNATCFVSESNSSIWPLKHAVIKGNKEAVDMRMEYNANLNKTDEANMTVLHHAAARGHHDIILTFLKNGADINATTLDLLTPLHLAVQHGHHDITKLLLQNKADVNATTNLYWSAIHLAARFNLPDMIQLLNEHGAILDIVSPDQRTALHIAVIYGRVEAMQMLLDLGCNIDAPDGGYRTPLHLACVIDCRELQHTIVHDDDNIDVNTKVTMVKLLIMGHSILKRPVVPQ